MKIWKPGTDGESGDDLLLEVVVDDDSHRYKELMGEHYLLLKFALAEYVVIPKGAWCEFEGETYALEDPSEVTVVHSREYEYSATLWSPFVRAARVMCRDTASGRLKFPLTAKPVEHLQLIVANLNRNSPGWTVGDCLDAKEKVVQYNHSNCADALAAVAEAFETEYEVVRKVVSLKKVEYNKDSPLPLSYGKGNGIKSGVSRSNDDSFPVTTLFVQGGSRNISLADYGSDELLLPATVTVRYDGERFDDEEGFDIASSRAYLTMSDGRSVVCVSDGASPSAPGNEASIDLSDIYPHREGTVTSVVAVDAGKNLYDIVDDTIPSTLDYEECLIEGETMTVAFQSGMLAGREFEARYIHDSVGGKQPRRFELVPAEMDGYTMPGGNYVPAEGDAYAVFGTMLPQAYICDNETRTGASWDMLREAVRSLWEQGSRNYEIKAELDGIWTKSDWLNIGGRIRIGGYISYSGPIIDNASVYNANALKMRIISVKQYVNNPYSPEVVFANGLVSASRWNSTVGRIDKAEVVIEENRKEAAAFAKRRFRDAQETITMLQDSMLGFGESITPAAVQTMALLVGDRRLQFRFVRSIGNPAPVAHSVVWDKEFSVVRAEGGVIQHMTLGIDSVSPSHPADAYTYWALAAFESPPLVDGAKKYYLYAKVPAASGPGEFLLSEDGLAFEGEDGHYNLLVGILNSEWLGERSWVSLYGFTEILPGQISTELLKDPQGRLVIDLSAGKVSGPVEFAAGSSGLENLEEWPEKQENIEALMQAAESLSERLGMWASDGYVSPPEKGWLLQLADDIFSDFNEISAYVGDLGLASEQAYKDFNEAYLLAMAAISKYAASTPESIPVDDDYGDIESYYEKRTPLVQYISLVLNQKVANAEFTAEEAAAKLEGFTRIEGGLIYSNILKLMEVDGTETSGVSGITKDEAGESLPFAWAGGTYAEAKAGAAVVIIRHDGRAKFGQCVIDPLGRFVVYDAGNTGNPVIKVSRSLVPSEASLKEGDVDEDVANTAHSYAHRSPPASFSSYYDFQNAIVVADNGTTLTVDTTLHSNAVAAGGFSGEYSVETSLLLVDDSGVAAANLGYVKASSSDTVGGSKTLYVHKSVLVAKGTYRLRHVYVISRTGTGVVALSSKVDESTVNIRYIRLYTNTELGKNGTMVSRDSGNFASTVVENNKMKHVIRTGLGYIDVPGVLAAGQVSTSGSILYKWGCKSGLFSAEWGSLGTTGWCTVTHNFGHTSYHVMVTMAADGCTGYIESRLSNYFRVVVKKNGTAAAAAFYFIVVGDNRPSLNA